MKYDLSSLVLTAAGIDYMTANSLVMRNSHTDQVESLHYGRSNKTHTHSAGGGRFSVPLWTVSYPSLLRAIELKDLTRDTITVFDEDRRGPKFPRLPAEQIESTDYIDNYIDKIKKSILDFTAFGSRAEANYNFELLIAKADNKSIDSLWGYPTGGRSSVPIDQETIVYRITFNEKDIAFFKAILAGEKDDEILLRDSLFPLNGKTRESVRAMVCNHLAVEIITSKLMIFLNAAGKLKQVIAFHDDDRSVLLSKACEASRIETDKLINYKRETYVGRDHYAAYQSSTKPTHERFAHPKYMVKPKSDKVSLAKQITNHVKEHGRPAMIQDEMIQAMGAAIAALSSRSHLDASDGAQKKAQLTGCLQRYETATNKLEADDAIRDFVLISARPRDSKWLSLFTSKYAETKSFLTFYEHLKTKTSQTTVHQIFGYNPVLTNDPCGFFNHLRTMQFQSAIPPNPSTS